MNRDGTTALDPDRRPPAPPHPGWADFPRGTTVAVCHGCSAVVPATAADIAARNRVNALDDTQPGNGSEIALADGRNRRDHAYGDFIEIVRHAERLVYDGTTAIKIEAELDNARRQGQARQHTDRATVQAIVTYATEWLAQIDGDES